MKLIVIGAGTDGSARAAALAAALAARGHEVNTTPSFADRPDLVVVIGAALDAAVRAVLARSRRKQVPVVLLSADGAGGGRSTTPDWVITPSHAARVRAAESFPLPPYRVTQVPAAFDALDEQGLATIERTFAKMGALGGYRSPVPRAIVRWGRPLLAKLASFELMAPPPPPKVKLTAAEAAAAQAAKAAAKQAAREAKAAARAAEKAAQKAAIKTEKKKAAPAKL